MAHLWLVSVDRPGWPKYLTGDCSAYHHGERNRVWSISIMASPYFGMVSLVAITYILISLILYKDN